MRSALQPRADATAASIERIYYGEPGGMVSWRYPGSPQHHLLPRRLDLANHSPTGFSWGYGGSGPAQLALALLAHALGNDDAALRLYQQFKFRAVANLPPRWTMTRSRIVAYAAELERAAPQEAAS